MNTETKPYINHRPSGGGLTSGSSGGSGGGIHASPRSSSVQGNYLPGSPHRPAAKMNEVLPTYKSISSEGNSGSDARTGSPDSTTSNSILTSPQKSFLACSAGETPETPKSLSGIPSAPTINTDEQTADFISSTSKTFSISDYTSKSTDHKQNISPPREILRQLKDFKYVAPETLPKEFTDNFLSSSEKKSVLILQKDKLNVLQENHNSKFNISNTPIMTDKERLTNNIREPIADCNCLKNSISSHENGNF